MQPQPRICRKCLTRDFDKKELFQNMYDYIDNLEEDIRTPNALYEERLNMCQNCERLIDGMCNACGCFVEMRAAVRMKDCPYKKW